jgi:hypothetical protein
MAINTLAELLSQPYDCLLLVHPYIQILEKLSTEIQESGVSHLNISKELSTSLMTVSSSERSRFSQKWLIDTIAIFQNGPVLCTCPDLLFDPSLKIDPLSLIRQVARIKQLIVLWPGEYSTNTLSYAVPEHHHFRTWKVTDSLLRQPVVLIHQISASQGA